MPNPIIAQRHLKAMKAAEAAQNRALLKAAPEAAKPKEDVVKAATRASAIENRPAAGKELLETLPDDDLVKRCKVLFGKEYDAKWDRDEMIRRLNAVGATVA